MILKEKMMNQKLRNIGQLSPGNQKKRKKKCIDQENQAFLVFQLQLKVKAY